MSEGRLCSCPRRDHEGPPASDALGIEPGACRKYAADQQRGGLCESCVSWDHKWTEARRR